MYYALWGDHEVLQEKYTSINSIEGMLCLWNKKAFQVNNSSIGEGFLALEGVWLKRGGNNQCLLTLQFGGKEKIMARFEGLQNEL